MEPIKRYRGSLLGLAAGDAPGTTREFRPPGSFAPIAEMVGGGPFALAPGPWNDATSMALGLAESLIERLGCDATDQMARYVRRFRKVHLSNAGGCFGIGGTTRAALLRFLKGGDPYAGSTAPGAAGNGSILRLAPVTLFFAATPEEAIARAADGSRTTHGTRKRRRPPLLRGAAIVAVVVALAWAARALPPEMVIAELRRGIAGLGVWGPVVFGLGDALAIAVMVPVAALTLAAGALFGRVVGTIVASVASALGAALAFLIARYLARGWLEALLARDARFAAIDRAVAAEGWKIVALLRLFPIIPNNMQNYLYGLTGIRFWPYILTNWLAMLPWTLFYVFLGHAGLSGLEAVAGFARRARSPAEWALWLVGLLAAVAALGYAARRAHRAVARRVGIEGGAADAGAPASGPVL